MHVMDFDLNLLKTLDAVLETRSVTRAAQRLGLSQPATSHALSRLRAALGDQLLVRSGAEQVLTDRAEALREPVKETLRRAEQVLLPAQVEPAQLVRSFNLDLADYNELALLPKLTDELSASAPGVSVTCRPHSSNPMEGLLGGADVWIGVNAPEAPGLFVQKLFTDSYLCVVRKGHPFAKKKVKLDQFVAYRHVQIAPGGKPGGPLDDALAAKGLSRTVAVRVPHFLVAPFLVSGSDLVLTAPKRIVEIFAPLADLHVFEPPIHIPGFTVQQAWLAKHHADPVHRWFRALVKKTSEPR
jgi:DNA-binding transcriptional LysR family regulator